MKHVEAGRQHEEETVKQICVWLQLQPYKH
jgi:hypothetical protein